MGTLEGGGGGGAPRPLEGGGGGGAELWEVEEGAVLLGGWRRRRCRKTTEICYSKPKQVNVKLLSGIGFKTETMTMEDLLTVSAIVC